MTHDTNTTRTDEERPDTIPGTAPREIFPSIPKWHKDKERLEKRFGMVLAGIPFHTGCLVYFIREVSGGNIKIGLARDVSRRMTVLQTAHPLKLELLGACEGGLKMEQALHKEFADDQLMGEWFKPSPRLSARIQELCSPLVSPLVKNEGGV